MQKHRIPGLQVAVVRHGKIVLLGAYGLANVEHSVPVTNETVFSINSATKSFTGVAIMQLVEDGKLDLAAPVSKYLDGLPDAWRAVTIRQLLTLTSGIPGISVEGGDEEAAWAKVQTLPMEFAPGERFSYTQTNYLLLGRIIDKLSDQPFTRFITERQFQVVGMPRTGFGDSSDVVPHAAQAYTTLRSVRGQYVRTDKFSRRFDEFPPSLRTAAGINSTAEELARWIIALQEGRLLKTKSSLATLWTPAALNNGASSGWALGWPARVRPEHRAVAGIGGMRSAFFVYPDDDLAVVILTNLSGAAPESFIDEVAGFYIPDMRASAGFGLPPVIKAVHTELLKRGFGHALEVVEEAKKRDPKLRLPEADVNAWGYRLLEAEQVKEAVEVFKLNVRLYPHSANTYDSLAEAYEEAGDKASAIENFKRSLELNSKNNNAVERLKKLEASGTNSHNLPDNDRTKSIDSAVEKAAKTFMEKGQTVGLSIGIYRDGRTYTYNFGTTERGKQQPPTAHTQYAIASITKTFTGTLLAQAAVEKKVSLDDDVRKYLPGEYPNLEYKGQPVRLWQLINHTSGLPMSLPEKPEWQAGEEKDIAKLASKEAAFLERYTQDDFLRDLHGVKLTRNPGEKFSYSNAAAQLLGLILERVYGQSYEELVRAKITGPLGMKDTKVTLTAAERERFPKGQSASGPFVPAFSGRLPAHGSLKSTTADMLKYIEWHLAEKDEAIKLSHRAAGNTVWSNDNSFTVGLNWQILQGPGRRTIVTDGNLPGHHCMCILRPESKVGIIALTNEEVRSKPANLSSLFNQILKEIDPRVPLVP
jgi:CubicO group peptidase (beta-lactamase class C family)